MEWTIVSIALMISLMGNIVQMCFYVMRVCLDVKSYRKEQEEQKKRDSYNNLHETEGAIFF